MTPPDPIQPPKFAGRLLQWLLKPMLVEEVMGDLAEQFQELQATQGQQRARWMYWRQVIGYIRPFALGLDAHAFVYWLPMFRHILTLTFRQARYQRSSFWIHLIGLSAGLAFSLLIYQWVLDERRVDAFHEHDDVLYQVRQNIPMGEGNLLNTTGTPALLAEALVQTFPEVEAAALAQENWLDSEGIIRAGERSFKAKELYVSPNFLSLFTFPLLTGNPHQVLQDPTSVLISEDLALRLFQSTENLIGRSVSWDQDWFNAGGEFQVAGVFRQPPPHSSLQFDLLFNFDYLFARNRNSFDRWDNNNVHTYLRLTADANPDTLEAKVADFLKKQLLPKYGPDQLSWVGSLQLAQFSSQYLNNRYENGQQTGGRISYLRLFSLIAILILVIAGINFMNLATARATRRMREVGVKKAMGVRRTTLIQQFLGEAILISCLALVLAILLATFLRPLFNEITGKTLTTTFSWTEALGFLGGTILLGLFAGSYPAFFLSRFQPSQVLKGRLPFGMGAVWIRRGLVVVQFALSILFIFCVMIIDQQVQFIQDQDLGYERERVLTFKREGGLNRNLEPFLAQVRQLPGVVSVSTSRHDLVGDIGGTSGIDWPGKAEGESIEFAGLNVDYGYLDLMGIELLSGRSFSPDYSQDTLKLLFNETAIRAMGLTDPVGKPMSLWGNDNFEIIGVVQDFHFESLYEPIKPLFIKLDPNSANILVKVAAGTEAHALAQLADLYATANPGLPFTYRFLEDDYQTLYQAEHRVAMLSRVFAALAILISCLGLLGLAMHSAERRTREVSIRKVLGADPWSLLALLSRDMTAMVLIAAGLALPLGYWLGNQWLGQFAYRIEISVWSMILAGSISLLLAWLTISWQTWKVLRSNPALALRSE